MHSQHSGHIGFCGKPCAQRGLFCETTQAMDARRWCADRGGVLKGLPEDGRVKKDQGAIPAIGQLATGDRHPRDWKTQSPPEDGLALALRNQASWTIATDQQLQGNSPLATPQ